MNKKVVFDQRLQEVKDQTNINNLVILTESFINNLDDLDRDQLLVNATSFFNSIDLRHISIEEKKMIKKFLKHEPKAGIGMLLIGAIGGVVGRSMWDMSIENQKKDSVDNHLELMTKIMALQASKKDNEAIFILTKLINKYNGQSYQKDDLYLDLLCTRGDLYKKMGECEKAKRDFEEVRNELQDVEENEMEVLIRLKILDEQLDMINSGITGLGADGNICKQDSDNSDTHSSFGGGDIEF